MNIVQAITPSDIQTARQLFREYAALLEVDLCFQNFEQELADLPGEYSPPSGRLLLALAETGIAGCVALRSIGNKVCEMKRLFVRPAFRDHGLGRKLAERIVEEARTIGYDKMRLDTLPGKMDRAIAMYRSLGFNEIERYYNNPYEDVLFMELEL